MKKCSKCKTLKPLCDFSKTKTNKDGLSYICTECNRENNKAYREKNAVRYYKTQQEIRSTFNGWLNNALHGARTRAGKKNFPFSITKEDIRELWESQQGLCAVTSVPMNFDCLNRKKANAYKCSIDRIDSNLGYTRDNIQLVCWAVNQMKADKTQEEFVFWIESIHKAISSQASKEEGSTTIPRGSTLK